MAYSRLVPSSVELLEGAAVFAVPGLNDNAQKLEAMSCSLANMVANESDIRAGDPVRLVYGTNRVGVNGDYGIVGVATRNSQTDGSVLVQIMGTALVRANGAVTSDAVGKTAVHVKGEHGVRVVGVDASTVSADNAVGVVRGVSADAYIVTIGLVGGDVTPAFDKRGLPAGMLAGSDALSQQSSAIGCFAFRSTWRSGENAFFDVIENTLVSSYTPSLSGRTLTIPLSRTFSAAQVRVISATEITGSISGSVLTLVNTAADWDDWGGVDFSQRIDVVVLGVM